MRNRNTVLQITANTLLTLTFFMLCQPILAEYIDPQQRFSLEPPAGWEVRMLESQPGLVAFRSSDGSSSLMILPTEVPESKALNALPSEYEELMRDSEPGVSLEIIKEARVEIAGYPGLQREYIMRKGDEDRARAIVVFTKAGQLSLTIAATSTSLDQIRPVFQRCIRTLSFSAPGRAPRRVELDVLQQTGVTGEDRREQIFSTYREFRRGIILLSQLESNLKEDIRELEMIMERRRISEIETEYAFQSIQTIREVVQDTVDALDQIRSFVEGSEVLDDRAFERFASEAISDERTKERVLLTVRLNGGARPMFENAHAKLESKLTFYSRCAEALQSKDIQSLGKSLQLLNDHYKGQFEDKSCRKEVWKKKLDEEAKKYAGKPYISEVVFEMCQKCPQIAKELNIDCPHESILCIIRPLICIVVLIVLIATEGTAH